MAYEFLHDIHLKNSSSKKKNVRWSQPFGMKENKYTLQKYFIFHHAKFKGETLINYTIILYFLFNFHHSIFIGTRCL